MLQTALFRVGASSGRREHLDQPLHPRVRSHLSGNELVKVGEACLVYALESATRCSVWSRHRINRLRMSAAFIAVIIVPIVTGNGI